MFRLITTVALGLILFALVVGCGTSSGTSKVGGKAPGFALADVRGGTVDFAEFKGKVVLVDFWATWCPPCRRSIPHLVDLHNRYSGKGFEVVGISLDRVSPDSVASFAQTYMIPYRVLMGNQEVAKNWNIGSGIPVAILVNRNGEVVEKIVGYKESSFWASKIEPYL